MLDGYFKNYFWTFHLVAIFLAALLLAKTVNAFVGRSLQVPPDKIASAASATPAVRKVEEKASIDLTAFLERNVFKAEREDLTPPPPEETDPKKAGEAGEIDEDNCVVASMGANLLATVVSSVPENSVAMFQDTSKNVTVEVRIGDRLLDEATVHAIEWRTVLVNKDGQCQEFSMEDEPKKVSRRATPKPAVASNNKSDDEGLGKGVKKVSDSEYEIPKEEIDNVLSNLNKVATQARIVPSFHNGKANGFKLFSIRPNSLYSKIGIQNGDIVQKINGYEMNSPDKALEIYSKLKDASTITVDLVRRGKSKSLSYSIR
ncbi:MAG: type II secretion system protein GspC [Deltaproteobacteria bacterium]